MKTCFGILYSPRAKECQICQHTEVCFEKTGVVKRPAVRSGYGVAILQIIFHCKRITVTDLKKELARRFGGKDPNVYYHLGVLKDQNLVDMQICGRKRFYTLR